MIKFFYTRFGNNKEESFEELEHAINEMMRHHNEGKSCAQIVVDFDNKIIYTITERSLESALEERDGYIGFAPKNFKEVPVDVYSDKSS